MTAADIITCVTYRAGEEGHCGGGRMDSGKTAQQTIYLAASVYSPKEPGKYGGQQRV